ncbi:hypothetical protein CCP4SC76_6910001 [Gammaproteobacteria bacterium]
MPTFQLASLIISSLSDFSHLATFVSSYFLFRLALFIFVRLFFYHVSPVLFLFFVFFFSLPFYVSSFFFLSSLLLLHVVAHFF